MTPEQDKLVLENRGLAGEIAKKFIGFPGYDYRDGVGVGYWALCRAAIMYKPERGRFSTYAGAAIKKEIKKALHNLSSVIRVPEGGIQLLKNGPTGGKLNARTYECAKNAHAVYFSQMRSQESENCYEPSEDIDTDSLDRDETVILNQAVASLDERERDIITRRFNLDRQEKGTLRDIGNKYGVTRERIRQLQQHALEMLRERIGERLTA